MHRSGTSAVAGSLAALGVEFGEHLIPAEADVNARGFWEHAALVALNDRILGELGHRWDDVRPLPDDWRSRPQVAAVRAEIADLLASEFGATPLWAFKDPRLCLLLPLWLDLLAEREIDCRLVVVVRHPEEVAKSLERRDGMSRAKALLLWFRHQLEIVRSIGGRPVFFVGYPEVVGRADEIFPALSARLGLELAYRDEPVKAFLAPELAHWARGGNLAAQPLPRPVERLQTLLERCVRENSDAALAELTAFAAEAAEVGRLWEPLGEVDGELEERLRRMAADYHRVAGQLRETDQGLEEAKEMVAAREFELRDCTDRVRQGEQALAHAEGLLERRDQELRATEQQLVQARDYLERRTAELAELDGRLHGCHEALASAQDIVEELRGHNRRLDERLGATDAALAEAQRIAVERLAELENTYAALRQRIEELNQRDRALQHAEEIVHTRNGEIALLNDALAASTGRERALVEIVTWVEANRIGRYLLRWRARQMSRAAGSQDE